MAKFILENTGGVNSPYYSDLKKIIKPDNSLSTRNSYNSIVANANGCITAECAAGIEERAKTPPDYVSAQVGAFGVSGGVSVNLLNGDVYLGGGKGNLTQGVGTSLLFGKLYATNFYGEERAKAVSTFLGAHPFKQQLVIVLFVQVLINQLLDPLQTQPLPMSLALGVG